MELNYRKAKMSEMDIAFDLLKEAAEWLNEKGIDYWQVWHDPTEEYKDWIKHGFENREFYFVEKDKKIVGMFRLKFHDEMFWGEKNDKAGYIHSFTTKRSLKGHGIGTQILKDIEDKLKSKSKNILRLDCGADNKKLCNYYEDYGFSEASITELKEDKLRLYEKRID